MSMKLEDLREHGIAILRVGFGLAFIGHGWPKLVGGPERWAKVGGAMGNFGIDFAHTWWGFAAGAAEVFGGFFLVLGLGTRLFAALLAFTMLVAMVRHIADGDSFGGWSNALKAGIAFVALFFIGPGRFSLDHLIAGRRAGPSDEG